MSEKTKLIVKDMIKYSSFAVMPLNIYVTHI